MRRVTPETYYSFNPATKTITVPRYIPKERLLLVTDVTNNTVIYNFSDTTLTATLSYDLTTSPPTTYIVTAYNTTGSSFASTDKLQILVDEIADYVTPMETQLDPVNKQRVSEPQALIDTDFEYGLQPTKWETLALTNNRPSFYVNYQAPLNVVDVTAVQNSTVFNVNVGYTTGTGTISITAATNAIVGTNTVFTRELQPGYVVYNSTFALCGTVAAIVSDTSAVLTAVTATAITPTAAWAYQNQPIPVIGQPVYVTDTNSAGNNGAFMVTGVQGTTGVANSLILNSRYAYTGTTGSIFNPAQTTAYLGYKYTGSDYAMGSPAITFSGTTATFNTSVPHGLQLGNGILVSNSNVSTFNGSWTVSTITSDTSFQVQLNATPATGSNVANVIARPDIVVNHRAFDGGVLFTTGNPLAHNAQVIRQTRRYFRYQSGKGLQVSTGTIVKPVIPVDQISANDTAVGALITIRTKTAHNLAPGANVFVGNSAINTGVNGITNGYAGSYIVQQTPNPYTALVYATQTLGSTSCTGLPVFGANNWYGSKVRVGSFDTQNGLFFEFDGQTLWAVRRSATQQIAGYASVTQNSSTVTGITVNSVTTQFANQLVEGDYIVIRGCTYRIIQVASQTSLTISPPYRGTTLGQVQISKVQDQKIPQSQWNMDRCDGTGPSGYLIDLTKIQMWYMDYSWYGAGFVRWGLRMTDGNVVYAHKLQHSNLQYEAYMRSGNIPAHYEVTTDSNETQLTSTFAAGATTLNVVNTAGFPGSGTLLIRSTTPEYVQYNSKTNTSFNVTVRGQSATTVASVTTVSGNANVTTSSSVSAIQIGQFVTGTGILGDTYITGITGGATNTITLSQAPSASGTITMSTLAMANANQTHTYSASSPTGIQLHSPYFTPVISHWGTSVIMDGRFDDDKSYVFIAGMVSSISVGPNTRQPLLSLRLGPSVDSGRIGLIGAREIVNRMQLTLRQIDLASNGLFLINLVLNGTPTGGTFSMVGGSSLAQVAYHSVSDRITGGETIFAFYANTAGGSNFTTTQQDLALVRDLGNSILGGGQNNSVGQQIYPDGPDIITIVAQNISSPANSASIQARLSWTEAQA